MGKLWDRLRRAWMAIQSKLQMKSSGKTSGEGEETKDEKSAAEVEHNAVFLRLKSYVESCEDEDVQVLWNMCLAESVRAEQAGDRATTGDGEITVAN